LRGTGVLAACWAGWNGRGSGDGNASGDRRCNGNASGDWCWHVSNWSAHRNGRADGNCAAYGNDDDNFDRPAPVGPQAT